MPVVPGNDVAPSSSRPGGKSREPARGDGSFADIVGRLVNEPSAKPAAARAATRGPAKTAEAPGVGQAPALDDSTGVEVAPASEAPKAGAVLMGTITPQPEAAADELPAEGLEVEAPADVLGVVAQELLSQLVSPVPAEPEQGDSTDQAEAGPLVELAAETAAADAAAIGPALVTGASATVATPRGPAVGATLNAAAPADAAAVAAAASEPGTVTSPDMPVEPSRGVADPGEITLPPELARTAKAAAENGADVDRPAAPRPGLPEQASPRAEAVRPAGVPPVAKGLDKAAKATVSASAGSVTMGVDAADAALPQATDAVAAAVASDEVVAEVQAQEPRAPSSARAADALASKFAKAGAGQDVKSPSRQTFDTDLSWGTVAAVPTQMAAALARAVSAASPLRLETDVLSAKSPAAYQHAAVSSGLPFSFDLQTALRAAEPAAQAAATVPVVPHQRTDTQDVPAQIVRAAHLQWRDGVGEARLRLNPEHLGEVTISLRVEQGSVFASVRAESPAALQAIQSRQQELQAALEAQGLHLDHFVTSADPDEQRQHQSQYRPPKQTQARSLPTDETETPRFEVLV